MLLARYELGSYILEDAILHIHRREKLESYIFYCLFIVFQHRRNHPVQSPRESLPIGRGEGLESVVDGKRIYRNFLLFYLMNFSYQSKKYVIFPPLSTVGKTFDLK
jgi:hypothetical protein